MESVAAVDLVLYLNVTRETLYTADFLSTFVAFCAVGNPFEIGVAL
jgi:hypothetical protein